MSNISIEKVIIAQYFMPLISSLFFTLIPIDSRRLSLFAFFMAFLNLSVSVALLTIFYQGEYFATKDIFHWNIFKGMGVKVSLGILSTFLISLNSLVLLFSVFLSNGNDEKGENGPYSLLFIMFTFINAALMSGDLLTFVIFEFFVSIALFFYYCHESKGPIHGKGLRPFSILLVGHSLIFSAIFYLYSLLYLRSEQFSIREMSFSFLEFRINEGIFPGMFPFWAFIFYIFLKLFVFPFYISSLDDARRGLKVSSLIYYVSFLILGINSLYKFVFPHFPRMSSLYQGQILLFCFILAMIFSLFLLKRNKVANLIRYSAHIFTFQILMGLFSFNLKSWEGTVFKLTFYTVSILLFAMINNNLLSMRQDRSGEIPLMKRIFLNYGLCFFMFNFLAFPGSLAFRADLLMVMGFFEENVLHSMAIVFGILLLSIGSYLSFNGISPSPILDRILKEKGDCAVDRNNLLEPIGHYSMIILVTYSVYLGWAKLDYSENLKKYFMAELVRINYD